MFFIRRLGGRGRVLRGRRELGRELGRGRPAEGGGLHNEAEGWGV
jgi:hypothetical protein